MLMLALALKLALVLLYLELTGDNSCPNSAKITLKLFPTKGVSTKLKDRCPLLWRGLRTDRNRSFWENNLKSKNISEETLFLGNEKSDG